MSTLVPSLNAGISRVLVSYDIACQWHKNLQAHLNTYHAFPPLKLSTLKYWKVVVPKFHLPGHGKDCQLSYNLAYTKWAGRTDGERIEAGWAQVVPVATWTWESGPNARRGILDDHWNAGNWRKTLKLGTFSLVRLQDTPSRLVQVYPSTKTSNAHSHGAQVSGRLPPSFPRATRLISLPSGAECRPILISTPLCPIHIRKLNGVRFFISPRRLFAYLPNP